MTYKLFKETITSIKNVEKQSADVFSRKGVLYKTHRKTPVPESLL